MVLALDFSEWISQNYSLSLSLESFLLKVSSHPSEQELISNKSQLYSFLTGY